LTPQEFDALEVGDIVGGTAGEYVITERRPNGLDWRQTRAIVNPNDWLCSRARGAWMSYDDRAKLVAGDWVQLQGGPSFVIGMPFSSREAATAVCVLEISGLRPEDWSLVRKGRTRALSSFW
jgi:hypothetical protein